MKSKIDYSLFLPTWHAIKNLWPRRRNEKWRRRRKRWQPGVDVDRGKSLPVYDMHVMLPTHHQLSLTQAKLKKWDPDIDMKGGDGSQKKGSQVWASSVELVVEDCAAMSPNPSAPRILDISSKHACPSTGVGLGLYERNLRSHNQ